jgi:hypothetical protein
MAGFFDFLDSLPSEEFTLMVMGLGIFAGVWLWGFGVGVKELNKTKKYLLEIMLSKDSPHIKLKAIARLLWGREVG